MPILVSSGQIVNETFYLKVLTLFVKKDMIFGRQETSSLSITTCLHTQPSLLRQFLVKMARFYFKAMGYDGLRNGVKNVYYGGSH